MRKVLEAVSLAGVLYLLGITAAALYGPGRLPARIPVHFDIAGRPDAWGSPWSMIGMPIVAVAIYILMTVVSRYPAAFNFPVRVTPRIRPHLESLAVDMISWLKLEVVALFAVIQTLIVGAVRHGGGTPAPWFVPAVIAAVFATILAYIVAMRRAARA